MLMAVSKEQPANPQAQAYRSQARWAKPLPHTHKNFIPPKSWFNYQFVDKDPELDFIKYAIEESGMTLEQIERETEKHGAKVSRYTLIAWYYGATKRPQNHTVNAVMAAIGWQRPWVRR